jgi:predicted RNA-binding protein with PUA-like domain
MNYWLIKSEGNCYSIDDLKRDKKAAWTGIRNYQARNFMRDDMRVGDLVLFYHSLGTPEAPSGIYGVAKVASKAKPEDDPIWAYVDMAFVSKFKAPVTLGDIKRDRALEGMEVRRPGSRLSVMPVSEKHFKHIVGKIAK